MEKAGDGAGRARSLPRLRREAADCTRCDLYRNATQTVFGAGPAKARVMLVGEQPGDQEDKQGLPFVGPSGRLLDEALARAGIARDDVYVTNVVKHFKWEPRGKRRIHQKPNAREIAACRPWLEGEVQALEPAVIVCLGSTAAQALLGKSFRVTKERGRPIASSLAAHVLATVHPSSVLRAPAETRARETALFMADIEAVAKFLK